MSVVTGVILHLALGDEDKIDQVNTFFREEDRLVSIESVNENDGKCHGKWYGGTKFFECRIYMASINHFDEDGFIEHLKTIDFEYQDRVQLFLSRDWEDAFEIINIFWDKLRKTTFKSRLLEEMRIYNESLDDIESSTASDEELSKVVNSFGHYDSFNVWSKKRVYFYVDNDGDWFISSVSRNPDWGG